MSFLSFVGKPLPHEAATTHFCYIGATGSGKTVCIRMLMQSALPLIGKGHNHRAVVYDAKRDMIPTLSGIISSKRIIPLNPFDARAFAWDISKDITTPANALQLATILIPPEKQVSQPFFGDAARHLLTGVVTAFIGLSNEREERKEPRIQWTLRDVILTMFQKDMLVNVLSQTDVTRPLVDLYFRNKETAQNIMSTVATKLNPYSIIAALWDRSYQEERKISLVDWLKTESLLVLGNDHTNRVAVDAINRVIFKRLSELVLAQEDLSKDQLRKPIPPRTWFFFDEFVRAGRLDGMVELATEGRSKGVSLVLGFQDIDGARAIYGREVAEEIIGQCSNIAILRLQSPQTSEWASRLFGKHEKLEEVYSENEGESESLAVFGLLGKGSSSGINKTWQLQAREAVLSSQFINLPMTNAKNGLTGYLFSPFFPNKKYLQRHHIPGEALFQNLCEKPEGVLGVDSRGGKQQFLENWKEGSKDWGRLNLPILRPGIFSRKEKTNKQKREKFLREVAEAGYQDAKTKNEIETTIIFSDEDKAQLRRLKREVELKERQAQEEKRHKMIKDLAALWVLRNQTATELEEVSSWDEQDQEEFYKILQELSGKPPMYVPPDEGKENDSFTITLSE